MTAAERLADLERRRANLWQGAQAFVDNKDAHGTMDMGCEIQALDRAIKELQELTS